MPFTVMFLPTDASPAPGQFDAAVHDVVAAEAGPIAADGTVHPPGHPPFVLDRGDFALRQISGSTCHLIFDAARKTNSIVITAGRGGPYLMMKGTTGKLPEYEAVPAVTPLVVPDSGALCVRLRKALRWWNHDIARAQREGLLDANEGFVMPPPDPGSEMRVVEDTSGVAAHCERMIALMEARIGWTVRRRLVTRSDKWGVVWRADLLPKDDGAGLWRETCWFMKGRRSGYATSTQPLEMFDEKRTTVKPLPAE